jgi:CheY-like chemotaxis protein
MACVLVVEDEALVLLLAKSILEQMGHDTFSAFLQVAASLAP